MNTSEVGLPLAIYTGPSFHITGIQHHCRSSFLVGGQTAKKALYLFYLYESFTKCLDIPTETAAGIEIEGE